MQAILDDIQKLDLRDMFNKAVSEIVEIVPTAEATPPTAPRPVWLCPIEEIRPMYVTDARMIQRQCMWSMIVYDGRGMLPIGAVDMCADLQAAIEEFIKEMAEARMCMFNVERDNIYVRYGSADMRWQIFIKGWRGILAYDAAPTEVAAAISRLDENTARMTKPLEVWVLWGLIKGARGVLSLADLVAAIDKWGGGGGGGGGDAPATYRELYTCVGMRVSDIIAHFATPDWICKWGPRPRPIK